MPAKCKGPKELHQKQLNFHDFVYGGQKNHRQVVDKFLLKL